IEINNPHGEVRTCGYLARLVGPLRPRLLYGLPLERGFAHTHHAVDLASLLHEQAFCHDVTVHHAGGLNLDALVGADAAAYFPTDDRLARNHVSFHLTPLPYEHLPARADGTHHRACDLHAAVARDVAHHAHPGSDDGQSGFRVH